jgi:hypothetical protein
MRNMSFSKVYIVIALIATVFLISLVCPSAQAQQRVNFTRSDKFSIPANNGTVSFGGNGSFASATLQNDFWIFTDLRLDGSVPLASLKISTENSNAIVTLYRTRNGTVPSESLSYRIAGEGRVMVNLGLSDKGLWNGGDWSVIQRQIGSTLFPAQGHDWNIGNEGTITVYELTGNMTITHYFFDRALGNVSNLPFYQQHSVAIEVAIAVTIVVMVASVIKLKSRLGPDGLEKNAKAFPKAKPVKQNSSGET